MKRIFVMIAAVLATAAAAVPARADTWTIGLYLCGSDLESRAGAATSDLVEAIGADLSDEVNVVIMTGGSSEWQNPVVDASKIQIWRVAEGDLELLAEGPRQNMGDPDTLASFLRYLRENFPADRRAFFMWDHGGGSAGGISYDENFNSDSITLLELASALNGSFDGKFDPQDPFFDLFGFDACLMATIDTASAIRPYAKYMVASQNLEPGNGWQYTYLLNELSKNTSIDGAALGRIVCDSFLAGCRDVGTDDGATLSVVDLSKIKLLCATYDLLGIEAFNKLNEMGNSFYSQWARSAKNADNYMNSKSEGFTNMVDLGGLVRHMSDTLPDGAEPTLEVLEQAVVYKVSGSAYPNSSGLSCYYPFDNSEATWRRLLLNEASSATAFNVLAGMKVGADVEKDYYGSVLEYIINSCEEVMQELQEEGPAQTQTQTPSGGGLFAQIQAASSAAQSVSAPSAVEAFDVTQLEDHPIEITDDGDIKIDLGPEVMENIEDVLFNLCYYSEEDDIMIILGSDGGLNGDWENGTFTDNFSGRWMALDDHLLMTEVTHYGQEMIRYAVPIILNGKRCALQMIYDFEAEAYALLGAREQRDADSPPDKILIQLKPGDEISTLCLARKMSADESADFEEVELETFKLSAGFKVDETDMGDGKFMFMFEMRDIQGNSALSNIAGIEVENGEISVMEL